MQPEVAKLLRDILEAGESVREFTEGMSFNDYLGARVVRLAVERQMITVGEALNNALQQDPTLREKITAAREIVAFRHILVHAYSIIDDDRVWGAIVSKLPLLLAEVRSLLPAT